MVRAHRSEGPETGRRTGEYAKGQQLPAGSGSSPECRRTVEEMLVTGKHGPGDGHHSRCGHRRRPSHPATITGAASIGNRWLRPGIEGVQFGQEFGHLRGCQYGEDITPQANEPALGQGPDGIRDTGFAARDQR